MGGNFGETSFVAVDIDLNTGDIAAGGYTKDIQLAPANSTTHNSIEPIIAYVMRGGYIRWAINLFNTASDYD
jgi:hypothetical protein